MTRTGDTFDTSKHKNKRRKAMIVNGALEILNQVTTLITRLFRRLESMRFYRCMYIRKTYELFFRI